MEMDKHEKTWVMNHLGHTLGVHDQFYRLSLDSASTAKVAKLLMLIDGGNIHRAVGKSLAEVDNILEEDELFSNEQITPADYAEEDTGGDSHGLDASISAAADSGNLPLPDMDGLEFPAMPDAVSNE